MSPLWTSFWRKPGGRVPRLQWSPSRMQERHIPFCAGRSAKQRNHRRRQTIELVLLLAGDGPEASDPGCCQASNLQGGP